MKFKSSLLALLLIVVTFVFILSPSFSVAAENISHTLEISSPGVASLLDNLAVALSSIRSFLISLLPSPNSSSPSAIVSPSFHLAIVPDDKNPSFGLSVIDTSTQQVVSPGGFVPLPNGITSLMTGTVALTKSGNFAYLIGYTNSTGSYDLLRFDFNSFTLTSLGDVQSLLGVSSNLFFVHDMEISPDDQYLLLSVGYLSSTGTVKNGVLAVFDPISGSLLHQVTLCTGSACGYNVPSYPYIAFSRNSRFAYISQSVSPPNPNVIHVVDLFASVPTVINTLTMSPYMYNIGGLKFSSPYLFALKGDCAAPSCTVVRRFDLTQNTFQDIGALTALPTNVPFGGGFYVAPTSASTVMLAAGDVLAGGPYPYDFMTLIDPISGAVTQIPSSPRTIIQAYDRPRKELWSVGVGNTVGSGTVDIFDLTTKTRTNVLPLPSVAVVSAPRGAISQDGNHVYIPDAKPNGGVNVFDTALHQQTSTISGVGFPDAIYMQGDNSVH